MLDPFVRHYLLHSSAAAFVNAAECPLPAPAYSCPLLPTPTIFALFVSCSLPIQKRINKEIPRAAFPGYVSICVQSVGVSMDVAHNL
jgi:hypothetical protein